MRSQATISAEQQTHPTGRAPPMHHGMACSDMLQPKQWCGVSQLQEHLAWLPIWKHESMHKQGLPTLGKLPRGACQTEQGLVYAGCRKWWGWLTASSAKATSAALSVMASSSGGPLGK